MSASGSNATGWPALPVSDPGSSDRVIVPISALQHYSFCPRQCALIHVERVWDENLLTTKGGLAHDKVHSGQDELRDGVRILRSVTLWCERLGLSGKSDVVELHPDDSVYPVEYKHGGRHKRIHDELQLCAQALCLEEMLGCEIPRGAIYHHKSRARRDVAFSAELRSAVEEAAVAVRLMLEQQSIPPPVADNRCMSCSLLEQCLPFPLKETRWQAVRGKLFNPAAADSDSPQKD